MRQRTFNLPQVFHQPVHILPTHIFLRPLQRTHEPEVFEYLTYGSFL